MYRIIFIVSLLISICGSLSAQYNHYDYFKEDVIYLKDGTIIQGKILEQKPGEYVKLELVGGSIFIIEQEKIQQITYEKGRFDRIKRNYNHGERGIFYREKGWYNHISLSTGFGQNQWGGLRLNPAIRYRKGYRSSRLLGLAAGSGIDFYPEGILLPVFVEASGDILRNHISPFYLVQAGYSLGLGPSMRNIQGVQGGFTWQAGAGLKFRGFNKTEWLLGLAYKVQDINFTLRPNEPNGRPAEARITRAGLVIHFSFAF
ncbi:MAG: hypothetical protein AAF206_01285 [Bacteroidota bacterium]